MPETTAVHGLHRTSLSIVHMDTLCAPRGTGIIEVRCYLFAVDRALITLLCLLGDSVPVELLSSSREGRTGPPTLNRSLESSSDTVDSRGYEKARITNHLGSNRLGM